MDKQGNIWFTANFKAYIGKLDTKTGKFTEYPLDPEARDPHTPIFDQKGNTLVLCTRGKHGGPAQHGDRRIKGCDFADAQVEPLRHGGHHEGHSLFRRIWSQQNRQHRSRDDGDS